MYGHERLPLHMDLSHTATVPAGKYDFSRLDLACIDPEVRRFIEYMLANKQIGFDWGRHLFNACRVPFIIDHDIPAHKDSGASIKDEDWVTCCPELLHESLASIFEGEFGPTSVDTIMKMENSGIKVSLCGHKRYLPTDPDQYMERLRQSLNA
jgi:hypothetical protein